MIKSVYFAIVPYTVIDYRMMIGWFIRKSFVIFVYRNILIELKGNSDRT